MGAPARVREGAPGPVRERAAGRIRRPVEGSIQRPFGDRGGIWNRPGGAACCRSPPSPPGRPGRDGGGVCVTDGVADAGASESSNALRLGAPGRPQPSARRPLGARLASAGSSAGRRRRLGAAVRGRGGIPAAGARRSRRRGRSPRLSPRHASGFGCLPSLSEGSTGVSSPPSGRKEVQARAEGRRKSPARLVRCGRCGLSRCRRAGRRPSRRGCGRR